jgi:hypothetical protein
MSPKTVAFLLFFRALFLSCGPEVKSGGFQRGKRLYDITSIGRLDKQVRESSGLALATRKWAGWRPVRKSGWSSTDTITLLTHGDSGNGTTLFEVSPTGQVVDQQEIARTANVDWEDLARDREGNLYLGDFGNNANSRRNLAIYKVKFDDEGLATQVDTIRFYYPDQGYFPPSGEENLNFDCEAFFWHNGQLHLFSKNLSQTKVRVVKHYVLPDYKGYHKATLDEKTIVLPEPITAADISLDGKLFALLSYGKIYVFNTPVSGNIFDNPLYVIKFPRAGQAESLVFINDTDFVFGNETGRLFLAKFRGR